MRSREFKQADADALSLRIGARDETALVSG
jgi:hypothetical protein